MSSSSSSSSSSPAASREVEQQKLNQVEHEKKKKTKISSEDDELDSSDDIEVVTTPPKGGSLDLLGNGGVLEDEDLSSSHSKYHDSSMLGDEEMGVVSKYAKVNQPSPFSKLQPKYPINLEWRHINYKVVIPMPPQNFFMKMLFKLPIPRSVSNLLKKKKVVPILNNVSGKVPSGSIIAIMGPTGSGKTTLLNVLARRTKKNVTGEILVNGETIPGNRFKRRMAYVLQEDIFFPHLTVRETVTYAAYLKLPKKLSMKEKRQRVDDILAEFGLQRCSSTIVGGGWVRGVSGGERKRTNISTELVSNPSLIFLDEPTSGLDASTSLGLIVSLKNLARSGHTVVATIHQPSSAMFMMFDNVILLAEGGYVVYSGSTAGVLPYFASLGLHSPTHYNPADFMLEVVTCNDKVSDERTVKQLLIDTYAQNEKKDDVAIEPLEITEDHDIATQDIMKGAKYPTNFWFQTWIMATRTFKQRRHDILSWSHTIQIAIIAIIAALLWFQLAKTEAAINDRVGFLFFSTMFWTLHTWIQSLYAFPAERAVLTKERATGTYRLSAFFIGKMIAETPLELVLPIMFALITYWVVYLSTDWYNFIFFIVILCLDTLMGAGLGLALSATIADIKQALTISILVVLSSVLLGGFFIRGSALPVWIAWARWLSVIKYSFELIMLNEFQLSSGETFTNSAQSSYTVHPITGQAILDNYDIETNVWGDVIFLCGMIVLARIAAYLSLRFLNKPRS